MAPIITLLADICLIGGIFIAVIQLIKSYENNKLQKESFIRDHERRKKQSTIEYYNLISQENHNLIKDIKSKCPGEIITHDDIVSDSELHNIVVRYLNVMECFAIGIHTRVYDIDIFRLIGRSETIYNYNLLQNYIKKQRELRYPSMYCELELLVETLGTPKYSGPIEDARRQATIE